MNSVKMLVENGIIYLFFSVEFVNSNFSAMKSLAILQDFKAMKCLFIVCLCSSLIIIEGTVVPRV